LDSPSVCLSISQPASIRPAAKTGELGETSQRMSGVPGNTTSYQYGLQSDLNESHIQIPSVFLRGTRRQITTFMQLLYTNSEIPYMIR
jgi:hypothetical protein